MATQKVTYQCASCASTKEIEVQEGQEAQAPNCCGAPMKEVSRK